MFLWFFLVYVYKCNSDRVLCKTTECLHKRLCRGAGYFVRGLHLDRNFSWTTHIDHLTKKCLQATACLWRYRNCFTWAARRAWYIRIVLSSLVYASNPFFPSLSMSSRQPISTLSEEPIHAVCQVHIPASTSSLLHQLGLLSVEQSMMKKMLMFVFRCVHSEVSCLLVLMFSLTRDVTQSDVATRGASTSSLVVPFLPVPSGRLSIRFRASIAWYSLPPVLRTLEGRKLLREHLILHNVPF